MAEPEISAPADAETAELESSVRRVVLASFIGTTIEWYDFFLYGTAAALVFKDIFFPKFDEFAGTMASLGTFSIGFFARPIGGVVFGHFGDRIGRKSMLVTTLLLMGVATFLIGLLPTYAQIGVAAPVLLVLLRFVQGFGVGGEWGGAVLMAVEHGHRGKRGLYASWVQAGVPAGLLLATAIFYLCSQLPEEAFLSWGWRVPFLLGIGLLGVGMFIRLRVLESPLFTRLQENRKSVRVPILHVLRHYPRSVLLAIGARFAESGCFYIFTVLVLTYATDVRQLDRSLLLNAQLAASAVQFVAIPLFGLWSDRVGRRPVYLGGAIALALFAYPFFLLIDTGVPALVYLATVVGLVVHSAMYAPQAAFFCELFGTEVRYSGASLGYQLAAPLAGGLAPLIGTLLLEVTDNQPWSVAVYLIAMALVTIVSVYLSAETHRADLHDGDE